MLQIDKKDLVKSILSSERCQRNWDLSLEIPEEDIEVIKVAVSRCPSKQNATYYKAHFITNRDQIEKIHTASLGSRTVDKETNVDKINTNSQLLANLLVVLTEAGSEADKYRNPQQKVNANIELSKIEYDHELMIHMQDESEMYVSLHKDYIRDRQVAVGIAAGYMNLSASLLGYKTGCCQCFDQRRVKEIIGEDNNILLIMGIGYSDSNRPRREHHMEKNAVFRTFNKEIEIVRHI